MYCVRNSGELYFKEIARGSVLEERKRFPWKKVCFMIKNRGENLWKIGDYRRFLDKIGRGHEEIQETGGCCLELQRGQVVLNENRKK